MGNDKSIKSEFETASSIFVVAENVLLFITLLNISSYPGSSFNGNFPEFTFWTRFSFMSTPIVDNPDFAKDNAVGRPILPIPITQTRRDFLANDSRTSSDYS